MRWAVLLLCCVSLTGCSVKFVYNNADRLVRWEVSDYVRLNAEQRVYFDAELATLLYWHRTTQLLEYAEFLEGFAAAVPRGFTASQLRAYFDQAEDLGERLEQRMLPIAVQILLSLDDTQREQLPAKLAEGNEEWGEDEIGKTTAQAQLRWAKEVRDGFQRFSGRMTRGQWEQLQVMAQNYQPHLVLWMEYRDRWQQALLNLLQADLEPAAFAAAFVQLSNDREAYYGEFGPVFAANEAAGTDIAVWLLANLTERQQDRLIETLTDFAQDFRELAAEAAPQPPPPATCLVPLRDCSGRID